MERAEFYRDAEPAVGGPLAGVRVADVTTAWAGPMGSCVLADLGCDVIRVEAPGVGGGMHVPPTIPGTTLSWANETVNRNKRSISLDLRVEAGRAVFLRLVATADIVLENFKPGTLASWGVGYEDCRRINPGIVYVSLSGWGQYGPASGQGGYDPVALAASGWMSLNGSPDGPPTKAPTYLADDLGGLHAAIGAIAALRYRDQTGVGQHVDVAMLDAILFQSNGLLTLGALGVPLPRWGNQVGVSVPCDAYPCRDGYLYLAVGLDTHWRKLAALIDRDELGRAPGFATNLERLENRDAVNAVVRNWCSTRTAEEAARLLTDSGLVAAPVRTFEEAAVDPHVAERGMLVDVTLSDGTTAPLTGPAAKFSRTPTTIRNGAPVSGTHTDEVLTELGVTDEELGRLRKAGVI